MMQAKPNTIWGHTLSLEGPTYKHMHAARQTTHTNTCTHTRTHTNNTLRYTRANQGLHASTKLASGALHPLSRPTRTMERCYLLHIDHQGPWNAAVHAHRPPMTMERCCPFTSTTKDHGKMLPPSHRSTRTTAWRDSC